jgi:hypothetical protein
MEAWCANAGNSLPNWKFAMKKEAVRLKRIAITAPFILAMWMPGQCWAQSTNAEFVHPPQVSPRKAVSDDRLHPPPSPFSQPQNTVKAPVVREPQPGHNAAGRYDEDSDNLIRMWKNRRPMDERQREIENSLGMHSEPQGAAPAVTSPNSATPTTTAWSQIGSGIWRKDGVHFAAGRIRQATYAFDNAQGTTTLWLGATGGGLWKALGGVIFVPVSSTLPGSPSVGAFLVQPGNSNNILIGSGDLNRVPGTGMYKTTDDGATWRAVSPSDGTFWPETFQKILIDVNDSSNQTVVAQGDSGIWRSTDFGDSWTRVYSGSATDLVQDTIHPWIWYAGAPGIGVLRSTSYGQSFAPIGSGIVGPVGRVAVALSKSAPWHVYAMTATGDWKYLEGIWRSDSYGDGVWLVIRGGEGPNTKTPFSGIGQAFHTTTLAVDPNNADVVFAGMAGMLVTYDGTAGAPVWTHCGVDPGCPDDGHSDHTEFVFEPGTQNVLGTGDGGGVRFQ